MITFTCARCGSLATDETADRLEAATVLICDQCGKRTVAELRTAAGAKLLDDAKELLLEFIRAEPVARVADTCIYCFGKWTEGQGIQHTDTCVWIRGHQWAERIPARLPRRRRGMQP